ncbi:MAG: tellurium resistance protein TerY, partial [Gammaproteobacteria bacterium]
MFIRRLPVYLLLDCSASMTGQAIEQVRQGLRALLDDLSTEPMAIETVYLSVITF